MLQEKHSNSKEREHTIT